MSSHKNPHDIFSRVDTTLTLSQLLDLATNAYNLGGIQKSTPILTGYQDCNIDLETSHGRFVVKIFSSEKTKQRISDVLAGYISCRKLGINVPLLRETTAKQTYLELSGVAHPLYLSVFEYFEGKPLTKTPVTTEDLIAISGMIAKIHQLHKPIPNYYDTLGIISVAREYKNKSEALSSDEQTKIVPVINKFQRINLKALPQSIIHGTPEKENILKSAGGELCLLDLGCMDYNASVLDIAVFIANFTLYVSEEKRAHIIRTIIDAYNAIRPITPAEMTILPALIRAQYAAYIIGMSFRMRREHDMTKQTQTWLDRGWDGLRSYAAVRKIL